MEKKERWEGVSGGVDWEERMVGKGGSEYGTEGIN